MHQNLEFASKIGIIFPKLGWLDTLINRPYAWWRFADQFHHQASHSVHSKCKCVPRGQELKRIPAWNVEKACTNYMGARRGGETDQQNVIMHKAYWCVQGCMHEGSRWGLQIALNFIHTFNVELSIFSHLFIQQFYFSVHIFFTNGNSCVLGITEPFPWWCVNILVQWNNRVQFSCFSYESSNTFYQG